MPNCSKCGMPIVWLGTVGGKRMPIDAVMRDLFIIDRKQTSGVGTTLSFRNAPVKGYTSHLSTCTFKDSVLPPQTPNKEKGD